LGRPFVYWFADSKVGHLLLLSGEKVKKAEDYFVEHGNISTFVGRLIPGIRQLISIPAGLAKMKFGPFILYTALGATSWNIVLALIGYLAQGNKELINEYSDELSHLILALLVIAIIFVVFKSIRKKKGKKQNSEA
ncbi:MAG: DedA family protein, partial [Bacteroidales bacterium]|nr:DedA family protein [Bacteroidales bacterium]